jgi:hypothetical protein
MTVRNVLEVLVKQTLERQPECRDLIEQAYAQHIREGTEPTEIELLSLLRELAGRMKCTFYILDALDVKIFITSRPLTTVQAKFPQAHIFIIAAQEVDIDLHIVKVLDECADLQEVLARAGPSLREEIISTIKQNCGGM